MRTLISRLARPLVTLAVMGAMIVVAGTATARSYGELLTSQEMPFFEQNARLRLDEAGSIDIFDTAFRGTNEGLGLGSGYIPAGTAFQYFHMLDPVDILDSLVGATLQVGVFDPDWSMEKQSISIDLGGEAWGQSSFRIFDVVGGQIQARMFESNGVLIASIYGTMNTNIGYSYLEVEYAGGSSGSGGGVSPMPEPGGVALFYAGLVVVGTARRQLRSWRRH